MNREELHLTVDLLLAVNRGELPPQRLAERLAEHLAAVCPECVARWQEYRRAGDLPPAARRAGYRRTLAGMRRRLRAAAARRADDDRRAEAEAAELLTLPAGERLRAIERSRVHRFRGPALTERLLAEARRWLRHDPRQAAELLTVARRQAVRIDPEVWGAGRVAALAARVDAHHANALRVAGELPRADAAWRRLRRRLAGRPPAEAGVGAELASLEASLRQDQRRFGEVDRLLAEAAALFRRDRDHEGEARVLTKVGGTLIRRGQPHEALEPLRSAERLLTAESDLELSAAVRSNLALALCDAGDPAAARAVLTASRSLYEGATDPWTALRLAWLEGRIAAGLGETGEARRRLRQAMNGYADRGLPYDAAVVALDLAELLLAAGDHRAVARLAAEVAGELAGRGVHAEAARALRLFRRAAAGGRLTAALLVALRRYLASARHDPTARFAPEPGSASG